MNDAAMMANAYVVGPMMSAISRVHVTRTQAQKILTRAAAAMAGAEPEAAIGSDALATRPLRGSGGDFGRRDETCRSIRTPATQRAPAAAGTFNATATPSRRAKAIRRDQPESGGRARQRRRRPCWPRTGCQPPRARRRHARTSSRDRPWRQTMRPQQETWRPWPRPEIQAARS